jgi:hypothetical protein
MNLTLFDPEARRIFLGERDQASPYGHSFGGSADYAGLAAFKRQPPVHLLLRLNMEDTAVTLSLPGIRWLPLLCAIRYGACDLGYRVVSDSEVKIFAQKETKAWKKFPFDGFPEKLPVEPVVLWEQAYEPGDPMEALRFAGVFGLDHLTSDQFSAVAAFVVEEGLFDPSFMDQETPEEYVREGNCLPFVQGKPSDDCPDPACPNHGQIGSLRILAIFEEDENRIRQLWGPNCGSLQILYQTCPTCGAIRTINQCT